MSLVSRIQTVRDRLRGATLANEASVSIGVVLPILDALGWPAFDPAVVAPEYSVGTRRVDFALLTHGRPAVFVEVKQPGLAGHADRQLFEYAFHEGVPIAILTDGATWHVYLPAMQGSYDDRRVYLLDLLEREPEESASRLRRYLSRAAVESGDAFERAQADYKRSRLQEGARKAVPQAWSNLVAEPRLTEMLAVEAGRLCGFQPEVADIEAFLTSLRPGNGALPDPIDPARGSWTGKGVTLPAGTELRGRHKKQEHLARVEGGKIVFEGTGFNTPSAAGQVAVNRQSCNGWTFWEVKRPGDAGWVSLTTLRG